MNSHTKQSPPSIGRRSYLRSKPCFYYLKPYFINFVDIGTRSWSTAILPWRARAATTTISTSTAFCSSVCKSHRSHLLPWIDFTSPSYRRRQGRHVLRPPPAAGLQDGIPRLFCQLRDQWGTAGPRQTRSCSESSRGGRLRRYVGLIRFHQY